jgi:hypothetical protein
LLHVPVSVPLLPAPQEASPAETSVACG